MIDFNAFKKSKHFLLPELPVLYVPCHLPLDHMFAKCVSISTDEWDLRKVSSRSKTSSLHIPTASNRSQGKNIVSAVMEGTTQSILPPLPKSCSSSTPYALSNSSSSLINRPPKNDSGERLYRQALERTKNLEMQRQKRLSKCQYHKVEQQKSRHCHNPSIQLDDEARRARLYSLPKEKQEYGKKRREAVAQASMKRNTLPGPEIFGKLPKSKTDNMYVKGVKALREKQTKLAKEYEKNQEKMTQRKDYGMISPNKADNMYLKGIQNLVLKEQRIAEKMQEKIEGEIANHRFKLAEGAFALTPDPDLKKRNIDSDTTACSSGCHFSISDDESLGLS